MTDGKSDAAIDPITAEIIRHALGAIPGRVDANIVRTAYSPLVYEYKDYAVGIVDHQGRLVSQSLGALPIFIANALGVAVRDGLDIYGPDGFEPGDVVISNHAGTLGQHLNNVVMYTPVFIGTELFGFVAIVMHWLDVGGAFVGSISPDATEIFQEGVQFRSLKLFRGGELDLGLRKTIEANSRFPRELWGDVAAQIAGCRKGSELTAAVVAKYGLETCRKAVDWIWDRSERAARAVILAIPDGVYAADAELDDDGIDLERRIPIGVDITVLGDQMTIDLSRTSDAVRGSINAGREGGAVAAARIAFKYLVQPNEPANEGTFRPLHVAIPDGKLLSAGPTAAMGSYNAALPITVDSILRALGPAIPDKVAAGHHGTFSAHLFIGRQPGSGELYQCLETGLGGWGATRAHDGIGPFKTMVHGDTLDVPVEAQEALYPLRIESYAFRPDSGGPGRLRGGLGLTKRYVVEEACQVIVIQDREYCPPWGLEGGLAGDPPSTVIISADGTETRARKGVFQLKAGDRLEVRSGGGGGHGDPLTRAPEAVRADLRKGLVSPGQARDSYGFERDGVGAPVPAVAG